MSIHSHPPLSLLHSKFPRLPNLHLAVATVSALVLTVAISMPTVAQNDGKTDVATLKEKLANLSSQMASLKKQLDTGEGNLNNLQKDYTDALQETTEVIEALHDVCLEAIEKDSSNQENVRTVMGILLNDADAGRDGKVLRSCDRLIKAGVNKAYFDYAAQADRLTLEAREIFDEVLIRQREFKARDLPRVLIETSKGPITVQLYENEAPQTVGNFISLVESGFYSNSLFHRVIDNFMAQVGGPKKDNQGDDDPGYTIYDECKRPDTRPHFTGVLSMAKTSAPDSGSSQFFITFSRTTHLDGKHTVFGRVIDGHEVVDRIVRTQIEINGQSTRVPNASPDYIKSASVIRKRDHKYRPRKVGEPEETDEPELPPVVPETKSLDELEQERASKEKMEAPEDTSAKKIDAVDDEKTETKPDDRPDNEEAVAKPAGELRETDSTDETDSSESPSDS